jgi:N-methylhydantoinase A
MHNEMVEEIEAAQYGEDVIVEITKSVDARYTGQSSELTLTVAGGTLKPEHISQLVHNFNEEHMKSYAHNRVDEPVDLVNLRLMARVIFPTEVDLDRLFDSGVGAKKVGKKRTRKAYFGKDYGWLETPIYQQVDLNEEATSGPMVIELYDTTCVVPPYATAKRGKWSTTEIEI